jgi:hypothetical protein
MPFPAPFSIKAWLPLPAALVATLLATLLAAPSPAAALFCRPERIILADEGGRAFVATAYARARITDPASPSRHFHVWEGRHADRPVFLVAETDHLGATVNSHAARPRLNASVNWAPRREAVEWAADDTDDAARVVFRVKSGPLRGAWWVEGCRGE